ncbi:MAG: bifunctional diaminohydroxyphosphoribosylaminopyrimidine deaminase/5-amino-6-(5-phosphoribosylamino)uracil reductase RibD [Acidobacteria bacterium]|nr:bifunctional diaminohydroxyphosphoribosylaminopyrimidine deaminase/5-amino-6-(5-phosphoribosylamino)uracil reductase RibD [Acidobacteriota bacterium]
MSATFTDLDRKHMSRALELARATEGLASPNPQVGCVIARGEDVVGEGAHRYAARDHAEVIALRQAADLAYGATAYVTLEPCSHHGRTGPCAHALVDAGVARVVAATLDPNPLVSGAGIAYLQQHGIVAEHGLLEEEARAVNDAFAHFMLTKRPLVTLKAALSVDGKLAPLPFQRTSATPFWLTGTAAREEVHRVRHAHDAILTGVGTLIADDPLLTDRSSIPRRRPLMRVLLDTNLRAPITARLFDTAQEDVLVLCANFAPEEKQKQLRGLGVRVETVPITRYAEGTHAIDLKKALEFLGTLDILSVLVEGGSRLNAAFLDADLVDKVILFFSEVELGNEAMPFATGNHSPFALMEKLQKIDRCDFKNAATGSIDACVRGNLHDPWADVFTLTPPKRAR